MKQFGNTFDDYYDSPMSEFPVLSKAFLCCISAILWVFSKIYWPWKYDGESPFEAPSAEGTGVGTIVICNHASMLDPVLLCLLSRGGKHHMRMLYKSEFDKSKFVSWFFSRMGGIPVRRASADTKVIKRSVAALKRGEDLLVFPEGTRVWDPEERRELYGGYALIAQMAGAEVSPAAIDGTERICPNKKGFPRPSRIRVRFGSKISMDQVPGDTRKQKTEAMQEIAMGRVYQMRKELRGE